MFQKVAILATIGLLFLAATVKAENPTEDELQPDTIEVRLLYFV